MIKINNKGFSLIELLGVIVLLGVVGAISVGAYNRYLRKTKIDVFNVMVDSAGSAAEEYFLDNNSLKEVTLEVLYDKGYLERPNDPFKSNAMCKGNVTKSSPDVDVTIAGEEEEAPLDSYYLMVEIECSDYKKCYTYPDKKECHGRIYWK